MSVYRRGISIWSMSLISTSMPVGHMSDTHIGKATHEGLPLLWPMTTSLAETSATKYRIEDQY
jgi:hypothetical protein